MRVWIRRIWATAGITFMGWLVWNAAAHGVDDALLQSSPTVQVERHDDYLVMTPASGPSASLLFLPGGGVDPDAYVPISIIEGANHAQFAYYGRQLGDCTADITRAAQQDALHTALMSWFRDNQLLR